MRPVRPFAGGADGIDFVERQRPDGAIYYLRNASDEARSVEALFRVTGKEPESWDAVTGRVTPLGYAIRDGQTRVPLELGPEESLFVVFRNEAREQSRILSAPATTQLVALDGDWSVTFEEGRGAPSGIKLSELAPLNEQAEPGVRYFSGVATYRKAFELAPGANAEGAIVIDLGSVGDIAEVWVNGALAGTAWQAPYRVDISQHVRPGHNEVEIRVANLWVNRLIGDAQPGAEPIGWTSVPMYKADAPLRPSCLIGPVRIVASE